jgi:hypothetical protein
VLGAILLPTVMSVARRAAAYPLAIATASPRDSDVLAYVASYLVPFASVNADTGKERIALGIFVALVAVLYVRSELFYINPLLAAVGYRVFAVETPGGTPVVLLCRRRFIRPDSEVRAVRISDCVWMEKKGDG